MAYAFDKGGDEMQAKAPPFQKSSKKLGKKKKAGKPFGKPPSLKGGGRY